MLVQISNKALFSAYLKEQNSRDDISRKTVYLDEKGKLRKITILADSVALVECVAEFTNQGKLKVQSLRNMYVDDKEFRSYCK